jgi:hypothetical protein
MKTRREFMHQTGLGLVLVGTGAGERWLTPRAARAEGAPVNVLDSLEVQTLEAFGETLLPGAREAGIAQYVDHHLSVEPSMSFLMLRYLDVPPPYAPFYKLGLANLNLAAHAAAGKPYAELGAEAQTDLVTRLSRENPPDWQGPPAPLFYFALRSDAVDVVYGTVEGFAKLGVPYMPHILPPTKW